MKTGYTKARLNLRHNQYGLLHYVVEGVEFDDDGNQCYTLIAEMPQARPLDKETAERLISAINGRTG